MVKKVAVIYSGAKYFGGVETYLNNLFGHIDNKKLKLTLVSLGKWELTDRLQKQGFECVIFNKHWWKFSNIFKITSFIRKNKFQLIVSQGMVANFYARKASFLTGIPNIITVHSDYKYDYPNWKKYVYWLTFRPLDFLTKHYITVSEFLKNGLIQMNIKPEKITTIYNGLEDLGQQPHKKSEKIIIGSLGRLHYKKGYAGLIESIRLIKHLDLELKIWGDGEEKEKLLELIRKYRLEDKVKLMGFTNDVKSALSEIDVYIQPSLEEGFGLTVAEAMLAGKPIIVTPAGSLPELIADGKTGFIVKDFTPKSITESLENIFGLKDSQALGITAREDALKRFDIEEWARKIADAYLEAAK